MSILRHWDETEVQTPGPFVRERAMTGQGGALVRLELKAGAKADRHSHAFEQFVQVVSGAGTLETEEGVQRFGAGHVFHFAPGTWHAAHFDEDTILVETNLA